MQRIALLDAPSVVGWTRWREIDEQHTRRGLRASIERLIVEGRLPPGNSVLYAHMVLAAVNEAALLIARADDPQAALAVGKDAVDTLLTRLAGGSAPPAATGARE